ncbi:MDR family MFS transporter [Microbacterium suwonense]|uniref:MFS transporter n=1 Tax=Microbacterium suwonense TaxID=683047 RepID=A0ABN6X0S1_9MICO|nr:MDR family MFS transporter [Microbacterium suwonense]BDZ38257.1 MFS transporter [Microbacterium suwonense]
MTSSRSFALPRDAIVTAFVLVAGGLAVIFDGTIMSIALNSLSVDLRVPISTIQWVTTGYLLALAVAIPVVGWAQARFGGKRVWMSALTLFMLTSVACSFAGDATMLIVFRVVQGIGGGLMMPLMATLAIQQVPKGASMGRLMAMVSLPAALGPILGPTIGGLLLNTLGWRSIFWVNVPLCLIGLALAWHFIPSDSPRGRPQLDWLGVLLVSPGVAGALYGLSNATAEGGPARLDVWAPLAGGLALLVVFAWHQIRRGTAALIDVGLLRTRSVASATVVLFLSSVAVYGGMLLLPLFFQVVRGADALTAGLLLIPQGIGALLSRTLAGRLTDSIGARTVAMGGFLVLAVATIPFAFAGPGTNELWLMAVLLIRGFGMGAVMIPVMSVAYVDLDRDSVPHASILTRLGQQLGGAFGTAVLAVILEAAAGGGAVTATAGGFATAFWWATGLSAIAILVCALLPKVRVPEPVTEGEGQPATS